MKLFTYSLIFFVINCSAQVNYKKLEKKAKFNYVAGHVFTTVLKAEFWKDKMPTTDKVKDYIQWNLRFDPAGNENLKFKKVYFIYSTEKAKSPSQIITYTYKNDIWFADEPKAKMQSAPHKIILEFEDSQNLKIQYLKTDGPFKIEDVQ